MATLREIRERRAKQPSLAELRARKQEAKAQSNGGLTALRQRKRQKRGDSPQDFVIDGIRYHNVVQIGKYWAIDVSNGDQTYTMHNRHSAWYHDIKGSSRMAEPVRVARALGTYMTQVEISMALTARLEAELKARGIPTREQQLRQKEEQELAARRKQRGKKSKESDDE